MLIEPLLQLLNKLKLLGMLAAMQRQLSDPDIAALRFEDRLAMLLQHELADRENVRFSQRLRIANLPQPACLEDLDTHIPTRHLDPAMISTVRDLGWIDRHLNVLITGPTGIGKSFIGAALAHAACRMNYHVRCFRLPRLIDELARAHAFQRRATFLRSLAKVDLLLIDDFGITPLSDQAKRDLLEILDDRYDRSATIITSQLEVKQWHAYIDDPTLADLDLSGDSVRKLKSLRAKGVKTGGAAAPSSAPARPS
jgi:DNA replication protein DnaC